MVKQIEWYYQFVHVEPLWGENDVIVFQFKLPLVGATYFIHYMIEAFPVPQSNGTVTTLEVHSNVGYHPTQDELLIPGSCRGRRPLVCEPTPVRIGQGLKCERGIVSNRHEERQSCLLKVQETLPVDEIWYTGENQAVLSTWGGRLHIRCKDKSEEMRTLSKGVYIFNLTQHCIYSGPTWRAQYTPVYTQKLHLQHRIVYDIAPVVIPDFVDTQGWQQRVRPDLQALGEVKMFQLSDLKDLQEFHLTSVPLHKKGWIWGTFILIIVAIAMLIFLVCYLKYKRCGQFKVKTPAVVLKYNINDDTSQQVDEPPCTNGASCSEAERSQEPLASLVVENEPFKFRFNDSSK